jgi:hypothetical protein
MTLLFELIGRGTSGEYHAFGFIVRPETAIALLCGKNRVVRKCLFNQQGALKRLQPNLNLNGETAGLKVLSQ